MKQIKFLIMVIMAGAISACTETVDVDVPDAGERLVVEASLDWELGTTGEYQTIKLSTSTTYFADSPEVPVTDALVIVTKEDDMTQFVFTHDQDGIYIATDFIAEIGQSYSLEIQYNGQTYTADETMMSVSEITRITQSTERGFSLDNIDITAYFDDPAGVKNYYLGEFTHPRSPIPAFWIISDEWTDGNENWIEVEHEDFQAGDTVFVNLYGISEEYYHYMVLLVHQSSQFNGGPFQTTPVQVNGNCKNINNEDEEVLGYFRLGQVDKKYHVIE